MPMTRSTQPKKRTANSSEVPGDQGHRSKRRGPSKRNQKNLPAPEQTPEVRLTTQNTDQSTPEPEQLTVDPVRQIPLSQLCFENYQEAKNTWPLADSQKQLANQAEENGKINPVVLNEAQNLVGDLEHGLHLLAMISKCNIDGLKRKM